MRLPIRANEYLLNVKFINRLLCFSTKGERRTVKIKGLTRVWVLEKFQILRYLWLVSRKFRKIWIFLLLCVYSTSFSLAWIGGKKFLLSWKRFIVFFFSLKQLCAEYNFPFPLPFALNFARFPSSENSLNFFTFRINVFLFATVNFFLFKSRVEEKKLFQPSSPTCFQKFHHHRFKNIPKKTSNTT